MNAAQKAQFEAWYTTVAQSTGGQRAAMEIAWEAALASQAKASFGFGDGYIVHGDKRSIEAVRAAVFVANTLDK